MKKINFLVAVIALLAIANVAVADNGKGKATTLKADVSKSTLNWNGKKVTGEHMGTIKLADGSLVVNGTKVTGGQFSIDMNSIVCTDLTDAEYNGKLIGHLKSEDFFNTAKFPTSTFKITKIAPKGGENYEITGDLTVKGITKPLTFPAVVKVTPAGAEASGKITIDRTKYDIKYGSKSFFASIGDKAINDDFTIDFKLVAAK
jgi:polyisoprenoid-binding protein YceI